METGKNLKVLRTKCGSEFNSEEFARYCTGHGAPSLNPLLSATNGIVERWNQTVVDMARSMLKAKGIPTAFWGKTVSTAVYILNRSHTKSLEDV
ncbi:LOW QUALITY PROTEIN: hypothetical protein U9M48_040224 [Paspalum notatum var. saurae]|uniref:Integrase catalytic domain-containing protein n=1 Tax=Paspalum notatum var. saurae TaxID=547442 RepID=A0AAQ3ULA4_PASNO